MRFEVCGGFVAIMLAGLALGVCPAAEEGRSEAGVPDASSSAAFRKHVEYLASDELAGRAPGFCKGSGLCGATLHPL